MIETYSTEQLSEIFKTITKEMINTFKKKNHDYGNSFFESLKKRGLIAALIRIEDKINRLNTLIDKNAEVDESISDTLLDLANYSIMTLMWNDQAKLINNSNFDSKEKWISIKKDLPEQGSEVFVMNDFAPNCIKPAKFDCDNFINNGFISDITVTHWHY